MKLKLFIAICSGLLIMVLFFLPETAQRQAHFFLQDFFDPAIGMLVKPVRAARLLFASNRDLIKSNQALKLELEQLQIQLHQMRPIERENRELHGLLGLSSRTKFKLIPGQITARNFNNWWQMARANKGLADGIRKDMPVVTAEGLVGRTIAASDRSCIILFLIDPNCEASARLSELDTIGIIHGKGVSPRGDALCQMDFLTKEAEIEPGQMVVTSGLGRIYPPGLTIGRVSKAYQDRSGLYQSADIIPAVNFRYLNFVFFVVRDQHSIKEISHE